MELVTINRTLTDEYVRLTQRHNLHPHGSVERAMIAARLEGFKSACKILGGDYSFALMEADAATMEIHGEVPMVGGCLLD